MALKLTVLDSRNHILGQIVHVSDAPQYRGDGAWGFWLVIHKGEEGDGRIARFHYLDDARFEAKKQWPGCRFKPFYNTSVGVA